MDDGAATGWAMALVLVLGTVSITAERANGLVVVLLTIDLVALYS